MKQDAMIYSIKCFLQANKDSANKNFFIYWAKTLFSIGLITTCATEKYF